MKIVELKPKVDNAKEDRKKSLLEIIDQFRQMVEEDHITDFVISSLDENGDVVITTCARDYVSAVGLYEMGKNTLLMTQMDIE